MKNANTSIIHFLPILLVPYCFFSIFILIQYEFENNAPYTFTFTYLGPLAVIMTLWVIKHEHSNYQNLIHALGRSIQLLMIGLFVTLMSTPYMLWINANFGHQSAVCVKGEIVG